MQPLYIKEYHAPCGELLLGSIGDALCLCDWRENAEQHTLPRLERLVQAEAIFEETEATRKASNELDEYFNGTRTAFSAELLASPTPLGTPFQCTVWDALRLIPYGHTCSYQDVATAIGRPSAVRAVATAIGRNPLSILIPCHRVIATSGGLGGYAGGLAAKRYLLELERKQFRG